MEGLGIVWTIIIGLLAGAIAGWIMKGKGFGFFLNIIIGLIGSFVGGWIYGLLGISSYGIIGNLLMATIGAIALLFVFSLLNKKK